MVVAVSCFLDFLLHGPRFPLFCGKRISNHALAGWPQTLFKLKESDHSPCSMSIELDIDSCTCLH
jgi:hypothetical protein